MIGVYAPGFDRWPVGEAMNKNLTVKMGNCNHRRYLPKLVAMVASGSIDLTPFITQHAVPSDALDAFESFDRRENGWLKTPLIVS